MKKQLDVFIENIIELKPELVSRFHVSHLSIFGSYVRGEETPESDLDILVSYSEMPTLFGFIELQIFLTESLGIKVDLGMPEDLKPRISKQIMTEKLTVV